MDSNLEARILICTDCNEEFVFTVEAQEYFAQKGYVDDPLMCKHCYNQSKRKGGRGDGANVGPKKHPKRPVDFPMEKSTSRDADFNR